MRVGPARGWWLAYVVMTVVCLWTGVRAIVNGAELFRHGIKGLGCCLEMDSILGPRI